MFQPGSQGNNMQGVGRAERGSQCLWSLNLALNHTSMLALTQQLLCPRVLLLSPVTNSTLGGWNRIGGWRLQSFMVQKKEDECVVCRCYLGGKKGGSRQDDKAYPFFLFHTSMGKTLILQLSRWWSSSHKITGIPSHSCVIIKLCLNHKEELLVSFLKKHTHIYVCIYT